MVTWCIYRFEIAENGFLQALFIPYPVAYPIRSLSESCQSSGVDGSHSFLLSSVLHHSDESQRFYTSCNQPRNVRRWRPRAHLPSILPVSTNSSGFSFLKMWPRLWTVFLYLSARCNTSSLEILSAFWLYTYAAYVWHTAFCLLTSFCDCWFYAYMILCGCNCINCIFRIFLFFSL